MHVEVILSCDLIKMAECMTAKPAVDEAIDGGKQKLIVMLTVEVFGEPAKNFCVAHMDYCFLGRQEILRERKASHNSHMKNN